ncbi:hypothetical protein L3Q82_026825, partial [Scortum barcoo]
ERAVSRLSGEWTQVESDHQEVTADLPRPAASLLRSAPLLPLLRSPLTDGVKAAEGRTGLPPSLSAAAAASEEEKARNHFGTEVRPSARPPRAAPRPRTAERSSRPLEGDPPRRGQSEGHVWGRCRAVSLGWSASGRLWGQPVAGGARQQEEQQEESRPFQRRSPGDASVNARAMSRRKQGNPQHLSQREITPSVVADLLDQSEFFLHTSNSTITTMLHRRLSIQMAACSPTPYPPTRLACPPTRWPASTQLASATSSPVGP